MAEFLAVVGSIGAIVNIIDATSKVISRIHTLHAQWNNADLTVLSLASQLSAFRAALRRIQEWLDSELSAAHHQLVMDLDETLSFCNILVVKIENVSAEWDSLLEDPKATAARRNVTFGNNGLDNILILVERQTSALTLLLTACNCNTMAEQKQLLEKPKTRRLLLKAKADSASLFVHRDTSSIRSKLTDNLSKMSLVFDFDPAVFSSDVYDRVFRGSLKSHLRQQQQQQQQLRALNQPDDEYAYDEADDVGRRIDIRELLPKMSLKRSTPLSAVLCGEDLMVVESCEENMLKGCYIFAELYNNCLDADDAERALPYIHHQAELISRQDVQTHAIWQNPAFQQLVASGPSEPAVGMTLCRFFTHQMKMLADDRFTYQAATCLATLARAHETALMYGGDFLIQANHAKWTDYSVYTSWSQTVTCPTKNELIIVITIPLALRHYVMCERHANMDGLAKSLQSVMADVKYRCPRKMTFVLLLDTPEEFIKKLPELCFATAPDTRTYYIDVILAKIVEVFQKSNKEDQQCDYLTIWSNQPFSGLIFDALGFVSNKGQVVKR